MGSFRGVLYALISSTTFGLVPFFSIALLGSGMSAATVLFYRMGVAALLIGLVAAAQRKSFVITAREFVIIVGLGWLYAGTSLGLILSYSLIPSGIATTIHFLYPILVTFLMIVFFREKRSAVNVLLIALVPTVISNLTLILAVKNVGSTVTAILGSMEPVTAVLVGIFHFGEPFNLQYASGLMLILASVCLVVWSNNRRHRIDR